MHILVELRKPLDGGEVALLVEQRVDQRLTRADPEPASAPSLSQDAVVLADRTISITHRSHAVSFRTGPARRVDAL